MKTMDEKQTKFINFCGKHKPTDEQQKAIFDKKSVVAAGAGSGKTATLSQRFLWLVYGKGLSANEILTITFTKDAASSMKSKIFKTLQKAFKEGLLPNDDQIKAFSNATICTTDSFCSEVAKMDCVQYGIPTNFSIEEESSIEAVSSDIVDKILKEVENEELLKKYLTFYSIDNIKETMLCLAKDYICISDPINTNDIISFVRENYSQSRISDLEDKLFFAIDDYENDQEIKKRKEQDDIALCSFKTNYNSNNTAELLRLRKALGGKCANDIKPHREEIKGIIRNLVIMISANNEEYIELLSFICKLINRYQEELLNHKKETGLVTFHDVMKLAIKILKNNKQVRNYYSEKFKAIMVDEFQDNNDDNKKLIYLLAATPDYADGSDIDAKVIDKNKIFMVGDEKQSIYRFRNADVSVFKGIAGELGEDSKCELSQNFRSEKTIINTINTLFEKIMGSDNESYEADFKNLVSENEKVKSSVTCMYMVEKKEEPEGCVSATESEAYNVAQKIYNIVNTYPEKFKVIEKYPDETEEERLPTYSDIAILLKVGTHQGNYEKTLRSLGIPVDVSESKALTTDAVLNDFYVILQLAVYGESDEVSKYAYLKGPFCRLTDKKIFTDKDTVYSQHSELISNVRNFLKNNNIAHTISYIWNDLGYRYYIIANKDNQAFEEHYDYIFKLANKFDEENKTILDFLAYIRPMLGSDSAIKDLSIQKEAASGVKIMSIHKSKGLEFPIVIVADMQSGTSSPGGFQPRVRLTNNNVVTLPFCPIFDEEKLSNPVEESVDDEVKKDNAETKRVFYVAATRAQYHLILSGVFPAKSSSKKKENENHFSQLDYFKETIKYDYDKDPFFENIKFEKFSYVSTADYEKEQSSTKNTTDYSIYETEPISACFKKQIVAVTDNENKDQYLNHSKPCKPFAIDSYLTNEEKITEFGSLVHKLFELQISKSNESVFGFFEGDEHKEEIYNCAKQLKDTFSKNDFILDLQSHCILQAEKPIIVNAFGKLENGVIDLLCIGKDKVTIIDYKTDKYIDPKAHEYQLNTYKLAIKSIYNLPVEAYLYYVREDLFVQA